MVLEPYLFDSSAHQFHSAMEIVRALAPIEPTLVVSQSVANLPFPPRLQVLPLFRSHANEFFNLGPAAASRMHPKLHKMVKSVSRRLRKAQVFARDRLQMQFTEWPEMDDVVEKSGCARADHIVIPTATPRLIVELRTSLRKLGALDGPRVHARFMVGDGPKMAQPLRALFSSMVSEPEKFDRLHIYAETPAMQRHLRDQYRVHADLFPYILNAPAVDASAAPARTRPVAFALLGSPRPEKGTGRLVAIMEKLAADSAFRMQEVAFIVQLDDRTKNKRAIAQPIIATAKRLGIALEAVPTGISSAQYDALLARADCLLLPYTSTRYALSGSGVVFEALARGKPFICSAGLAFSDYVHGGVIEAESDDAFAQAIKRFVADPQPFRAAAQQAAREYLEAQRLGPFLTRIRSART